MPASDTAIVQKLTQHLIEIISETNGLSLADTLELSEATPHIANDPELASSIHQFRDLLKQFQDDAIHINALLEHPISKAFFNFFKNFPIPFMEEHIHLTGSLSAEFIHPRLMNLLQGPNKKIYEEKIKQVYGPNIGEIKTIEDVRNLITLKDHERFERYLEILLLPKLILTDKQAHRDAAYSMASDLYQKYNVGKIRLKFTFSRASSSSSDQIPGIEEVSEEDVVLGLYEGFMDFKKANPFFHFILAPSFRKESHFFDSINYTSKKEHISAQVAKIVEIINKYPFLRTHLCEIDTVGNENNLYRKEHFNEMKAGFRKLQYLGFQIRSHHGETWHNLRKGIQAVDNAMNIWHIDNLEHGLSLGINPNYYFHSLYLRVLKWNIEGKKVKQGSIEYNELMDMDWRNDGIVREKLFSGEKLTQNETTIFLKTKFHMAREIEHYQHDVLNRMINKKVSLVALPSSNKKLTGNFEDYKDHPFSWWEKKGVSLGVGTDNYITLNTNFIQEMLILLYTDPFDLKITKLLMVTTGESRRPYISQLLWKMR